MRIIAGMYRGRKLAALRDLSIRPTTDRVKQTIFDILNSRVELEGTQVLDLFAGSGSLGLEALSRGASHVTFIEKVRPSLEALEKNIRTLGCENRSTVHQADVFWFLRNAHQPFDIVFVDPPYALETIGTLPAVIAGSGVVHKGSYVVMEHSRESDVPVPEESFEVLRKQFGQTVLLILKAVG
ncbi:MAG: 16S rRNA (guanine(966)-N(2))-methyltransferase RsmD [Bacteroidota bacterium]